MTRLVIACIGLAISAVSLAIAIVAELTRPEPFETAGQVIPGHHRPVRHLLCLFRGHGLPLRHPLGGFRCPFCGYSAVTQDGLGWEGRVPAERRPFQRDRYPGSSGGLR